MSNKTLDDLLKQVIQIRAMNRIVMLAKDAPECFEPDTEVLDAITEEETDFVMKQVRELAEKLAKPSAAYCATQNDKLQRKLASADTIA